METLAITTAAEQMEDHVVRWWIARTAKRLADSERFASGAVWSAEDFAQDLRADLCRRAAWFDPTRAAWRTFAKQVVARRAATLLEERSIELQGHGESDALQGTTDDADGHETLANQLAPADCHARRLQAYPREEHDLAQLQQDLAALISRLPARLHTVCSQFLAPEPGMPTPVLTPRQRTKLRRRFHAAGLDGYLL